MIKYVKKKKKSIKDEIIKDIQTVFQSEKEEEENYYEREGSVIFIVTIKLNMKKLR